MFILHCKKINTFIGSLCRESVYLSGGVLFVTSRILVVDMLTKKLPIHLVTGIVVYRAHKYGNPLALCMHQDYTSLVPVTKLLLVQVCIILQCTCTVFLSSFSIKINLLELHHECHPLIGYTTHVLFCDR